MCVAKLFGSTSDESWGYEGNSPVTGVTGL